MATPSGTRLAAIAAITVGAVGLAGCSGGGAGDGSARGDASTPAAMALVAYQSCDELLTGLRKAAASSAAARPPLLPGRGMPMPVGPDGAEMQAEAGDGRATAAGGQAQEHSTTNVHEPGVDEPDMVKTDGRRIVTVTRGTLRVIDAASRKETGVLPLSEANGGWGPADLLLHGDRVLVLTNQPVAYGVDRPQGVPGDGGLAEVPVPPHPLGPRLMLIDISGSPRLLSTLTVDGAYVDARQVGSVARIVVRSQPRLPLPTPDPGQPLTRQDGRRAAERAPLEAWLPRYEVTRGGRTQRHQVPCERVSHPPKYTGTSMLSVLTVDLGGAMDDADPISVVADGDKVYGTGSSLYVTSNPSAAVPFTRPDQAQRIRTEIHKFDVSGPGRPRYAASGTVPGTLLNQYSMSEHRGHLRVATTTTAPGTAAEGGSESSVTVLAQRGGRLTKVGGVGGLGKGERIFAVRFIGPTGYVVTFRRVDPLYTLDLRNPRQPRVTGELKITGYSAYLHPAGGGRLIGVGQDADEQGRTRGTQVSLFDVRDPARPRRLAAHRVAAASSEVEFDPHAFLYWPRSGLTVVPITSMEGGGGALVLSVRPDGIRDIGMVRHEATGEPVRRTLVIGDTLWTLSESGARASDATTLADRGSVAFS